MLATTLSRRLGHDTMYMLSHAGDNITESHAGDGAARATWPWRYVHTESWWHQCCQVMLATTLSGQLGRGVM
jgi:hypothetical protein